MNQYFESRKATPISEINSYEKLEGIIISDEREDEKLTWENVTINHSTFSNVSFKKSKIRKTDLSFCVFIDCYFKYTEMENVKLLSCKFINCTFDDIKLIESDIRFAVFDKCIIDYEEIVGCLPAQSNLKWKLCTNLALESLRIGDYVNYRKFFFSEKHACESHYFSIFIQRESYYKKKYDTLDRFVGLIQFLLSRISRIIWGYGEKIQNLVVVIISTIIGFAILYYFQGDVFKEANSVNTELKNLNFLESLYLSFCNTLTISSDFTSAHQGVRILTVIEGTMGVILMGFFVAALFRFINRR